MRTLKKRFILDAEIEQNDKLSKQAQKYFLGGGYGNEPVWCKIFTSACHCGDHLGWMTCPTNDSTCLLMCIDFAKEVFGETDPCCKCGVDPEW